MTRHVRLTPNEVLQGAIVGVMRQVANLRDGRTDRHGASTGDGWQLHCQGAIGELVVAKARNRYWSGNLGNLGAADVGCLQVRTTALRHGSLIIHPEDHDNAPFVLVCGYGLDYYLPGWCYGRDGKRPEFIRKPNEREPAYFVPQSLPLLDIATLPDDYLDMLCEPAGPQDRLPGLM